MKFGLSLFPAPPSLSRFRFGLNLVGARRNPAAFLLHVRCLLCDDVLSREGTGFCSRLCGRLYFEYGPDEGLRQLWRFGIQYVGRMEATVEAWAEDRANLWMAA